METINNSFDLIDIILVASILLSLLIYLFLIFLNINKLYFYRRVLVLSKSKKYLIGRFCLGIFTLCLAILIGKNFFRFTNSVSVLIFSFITIASLQIFFWNLTYNSQGDPYLSTELTIRRNLEGALWARLYLPELFRNANSVKKIDKKVQQIEEDIEQKQKDMDAQILVNRQLNIRFPPEETERLFKRIKAASIDAMRIIFVQAQAVRSDNWKDDKVKMERTIPVFKALIDGYKEKSKDPYHRHYAELGFALKDKREPDWEKAKESLEKAIELRGDFSKHGNWTTYYEFNHALCLIQLDSNLKNNTPSNEKTREAIIKDLKMAIEGGCLTKEKLKREDFKRWIEVNNVNWSDLGLTDD